MAIPGSRALSLGARPTGAPISGAAAGVRLYSEQSLPGRPSASWSFLLTTQQEIYMCVCVRVCVSGSSVNVQTEQQTNPQH